MREATIRVPEAEFENLGVETFLELCREAGLRDFGELACESDGCLLVVTVEEPVDGEVLSDLEYVVWWEQLSGPDDGHVYLCKVSMTALTEGAGSLQQLGVPSSEVDVSDGGMEVTLVGTQADISRGVAAYDEAGVSVRLQRITDYDGPRTPLSELTDRQREIVETAHEMGHFEVPRDASTADVAAELDLDASTVAEHLNRAQRNLLDELLAGP